MPHYFTVKAEYALRFSVRSACADISLKLRRNTEKAHTPVSLFSAQSSVVENMSMICCTWLWPSFAKKKKIGRIRRQLTRSKSRKTGYRNEIFSHTNLPSEFLYQQFVRRVFFITIRIFFHKHSCCLYISIKGERNARGMVRKSHTIHAIQSKSENKSSEQHTRSVLPSD
jgi:hypothetical protein